MIKHITNEYKGNTICSSVILSMFLVCICSKFKSYSNLRFSCQIIVVIWGVSKQNYWCMWVLCRMTHIEKQNTARFIILTFLQGVEQRVACPAVGLPSPSGQELFVGVFWNTIFLSTFYWSYSNLCTTTMPARSQAGVDTAPVQSPVATLKQRMAPNSRIFSLFLRPPLGIWTFVLSFVWGVCSM